MSDVDAEVCYSDNPSELEGKDCFENSDSEPNSNKVEVGEEEEGDGYEEEEEDEEEEDDEEEEEEDEEMNGDIPSPARQKKIMRLLESDQPKLVEGDLWYLIDIGWYRRWKQYVKFDYSSSGGTVMEPGPISNEGLLDQSGENKVLRNLIEHQHYAIISTKEWEHLHSWFVFFFFFHQQQKCFYLFVIIKQKDKNIYHYYILKNNN